MGDSEDGKVSAADSAQQEAFAAYHGQMELRNRVQIQYNNDQDALLNADAELQRVVTLCNQPQPPADCSLQLQSAEAAAEVANNTLAATKLALDQAQETLQADDEA